MKKVFKFGRKKKKEDAAPAAAASPTPSRGSAAAAADAGGSDRRRSSVVSGAAALLRGRRPSAASGSGTGGYPGGGATKLHAAVWAEDLEKVRRLASARGGDARAVNAADAGGRTPLHLAASKGMVALVWPLLSHGASVQVRDGEGATPLHRWAAGQIYYNVCRLASRRIVGTEYTEGRKRVPNRCADNYYFSCGNRATHT